MVSKTPNNTIRRVTDTQLRKMYNDAKYTERVNSGELKLVVKRSRVINDPTIQNWTPGTVSQEILIFDQNNEQLVRAHRYLRPDGKLAASGMIDPKRILHRGELYGLLKA